MRSLLPIIALTVAPCACVIDGVPLPDETQNTTDVTPNTNPPEELEGVYDTLSSGVTVIFGVPSSAPANAIVVVTSGSHQAQTATTVDGSFNVALIGALDASVDVRVLVDAQVVSEATLQPPPATLTAPDGVSSATTPTSGPANGGQTSTARVNVTSVTITFAAQSFSANARVAVADLDHGTTQTFSANAYGGLSANVNATKGDTLYVVAISATAATAPYVITAP